MPLLGASPLALPEQADLSGAWQEAISPPDPIAGGSLSRQIPGETYEQLISAHFALTTSALVGTRIVIYRVSDANGKIVAQAPASAGQGASQASGYSLTATTGQTFNPSVDAFQIAVPTLLLLPTWTVQIVVVNMAGNDQLSGFTMLMLRIPTAPPARVAELLASTPLVV